MFFISRSICIYIKNNIIIRLYSVFLKIFNFAVVGSPEYAGRSLNGEVFNAYQQGKQWQTILSL